MNGFDLLYGLLRWGRLVLDQGRCWQEENLCTRLALKTSSGPAAIRLRESCSDDAPACAPTTFVEHARRGPSPNLLTQLLS